VGLKEHEVAQLCGHLGHSTNVHKDYYRQASGFIERVNVAKLMLIQDYNVAGQFKNASLCDVKLDGKIL